MLLRALTGFLIPPCVPACHPQVVDGNWGVHVVLPKFVFDTAEKGAYKVRTGTPSDPRARTPQGP